MKLLCIVFYAQKWPMTYKHDHLLLKVISWTFCVFVKMMLVELTFPWHYGQHIWVTE